VFVTKAIKEIVMSNTLGREGMGRFVFFLSDNKLVGGVKSINMSTKV